MRVATNKLLLFSVLLSGLFACQKDPETQPEPPPAKNIKKISWSEQDFVTYEYNAAGLVTSYVSQWANGGGGVNKYTNTYTYNNEGQLNRCQTESGYSLYVYKGNKPESSEHFITNGRKLSSMKYQFEHNKLISVIERNEAPLPDDVIETKITYTYYPNGNVQRMDFAYRYQLSAPFVINFSKVIDAYDNKTNPEPDGVLGTILPGVVLHRNNPVKISTVLPNNTVEGYSRFEYTYNAEGLPQQRKHYIATNGVEQLPATSTFQY